MRPRTCEQNDSNAVVFAGVAESIVEFKYRFGAKGVAFVGTVDGDFGDAVSFVIKDVFVGLGDLPFNLHQCVCRKVYVSIVLGRVGNAASRLLAICDKPNSTV